MLSVKYVQNSITVVDPGPWSGFQQSWVMQNLPGLVNIQKAMENGHRNSGFTQIENGGSFHSNMLAYQRVNGALEKGLFFRQIYGNIWNKNSYN